MAKEGAQSAEETEQMIEKEGGKEAGEGSAAGSLRAADTKEMRAVVLSAFGGLNKLRVSKKAMPEPQDGELKIRVKACGLNFIDLMVRQGNIDNPPKTPLIPGFECSGIVEALGDSVKGFEIGDRVMAFINYSAWAEVVCTPVEFVYKIPDDMSFSEAAAFPMNFVTAYMMLFEVANLREGMSVLVHSAGGGVGQAVAQLCSTVPNVTVFGTASSFKHEAIKDSVTHLFDRNADYVQEVKRISADGVDIVLDCLCGENTGKGLSLLKPLGIYILYGSSNMVTGETKSFFSFAKSWWQVEKVNPIKLYEENKVIAGFSLLNLLFKQNRSGLIKSVMDKLLDLYNRENARSSYEGLLTPSIAPVVEAPQQVTETVQFTGRRLNSKMQVYSGSKPACLSKMLTLYEQCIRVLQNNIDSLHEVGGVPFEILEPVLTRCTPEQLLRIEECNPAFTEECDHLWKKHCQRDFKNKSLLEYESWREMYLRLRNQREEKLKTLTKNIISAQSEKPKGRQVKMAYMTSAAKTPRNIHRQQEIHRTAGPVTKLHPLEMCKTKIPESRNRNNTSSNPISASNSGSCSSSAMTQDGMKPIKKIAPIMKKTLRALKSRAGRR